MRINIGKLLKSIAVAAIGGAVTGAMSTANTEVPGAQTLISGIGKLLDHEDDNNAQGVDEIQRGLVDALSAIDPTKIDDAVEFADALKALQLDLQRAKRALKAIA
jgi:hypothetical protein